MLYTIGYQGMKISEFIDILKKHDIKYLVDVRSKPTSRNASFRRSPLSKVLLENSIQYIWMGDKLGGFGDIKERDIQGLADWEKGRTACLMCMEADPRQCHRYDRIAKRVSSYGVVALHIIKGGELLDHRLAESEVPHEHTT